MSNLLQDVGILGNPLDVLFTKFAVQLGVVYNYLPLMILPLFVALDRLDPALREASKDSERAVKNFRQVSVPLAMPGVIDRILLVFIPLLGRLHHRLRCSEGAKGNMVGRWWPSQFLTAQNWALGSAMAMILIGMILGVWGTSR